MHSTFLAKFFRSDGDGNGIKLTDNELFLF